MLKVTAGGIFEYKIVYVKSSVNSLLTLLVAAIVNTAAWLTFKQKKDFNKQLLGTALILVGISFFFIYVIVLVWLS
jgi:hypothetical protein